jgi:hypothetical protein
MACSRAAVSVGNFASVARMKGRYASMRLGRSGEGARRRPGRARAHGVAVHMQLPGDGAHPPLLHRVQAQDLRDQVRGYGHGATLGASGAGHGAGSPGAPRPGCGLAQRRQSQAWWRVVAVVVEVVVGVRPSGWWWPCPQARAPRWCGCPCGQWSRSHPGLGNPGASRSAARHRCHRRRRHHHRAHGGVGASAATARRGQSGLAETVGIDVHSRAEPRRAPGAGTAGRSSGCHGRSGCTARPDAATRAQEQAPWSIHAHLGRQPKLQCWTDASQRCHTDAAPPSSARCRARYGCQASRQERPLPRPPSSA